MRKLKLNIFVSYQDLGYCTQLLSVICHILYLLNNTDYLSYTHIFDMNKCLNVNCYIIQRL